MLGNIYNNTSNSSGGDASIDDSTSSVTGTYSSAKIDSDNAAQDAIQNAKYEIDANAIVSPAGITFDPSSTHNSIIMNPAAAANEYGSITMLSAVCIGKDVAKNGYAYSTVAIGHDSLKDGGSSSSVHIGINSGSTCRGNNHVHIGTGTGGSNGGEGNASSNRDGDTAIGTFSGLGEGRNLNRDHTIFIGNRCNDAMKNYTNSADITVSDYDIIIGASNNNIGPDNNRPLIHANGDDSSGYPEWSPGKPANLGSGSKVWQNIYLAGGVIFPNSGTFINAYGTTNMYDYVHYRRTTSQGPYGDTTTHMCTFPIAETPSSLSHITVGTSGSETYFTNATSETRRWQVSYTLGFSDNTTAFYARAAISLGTAPVGLSAIQYAESYSNENFGVTLNGSATIQVDMGESVAISMLADTPDSGTWTTGAASITIAELPM